MVQSTFVLYGFFELINGERKATPRRTDPSASTYHSYYNTAIQCVDNSGLGGEVRFFSPPSDTVLPEGTVAFINARARVPATLPRRLDTGEIAPGDPILLEGVRLAAFPGNPNDDNYQKQAPDLVYAMAYGVGVVKTNCPPPTPEGEKSFTVETCDLIRDVNNSSIIRCVLTLSFV